MRLRKAPTIGFVLILAGALLLAFKQVTRVFNDPRMLEQGAVVGDTVADPTWIIFAAVLLASGLATSLAGISPAKGWRRDVAAILLGINGTILLAMHLPLFVNGVTIGTERDLATHFSASFLFHTGDAYSFVAVFLLFLLTVIFLAIVVMSAAYLIAPQRFPRAIKDRTDWTKNEANLVASSLILGLGLGVFLVYLVRTIARLEEEPLNEPGFFAASLPVFYYLQIFFVALLLLTIVARVFLVNWGTSMPWDRGRVRDSLDNVGRAERILVAGALVFNVLILGAPAATDEAGLSVDPVFRLNSRGLAWSFFLLAIPFAPYASSLARLRNMLGQGQPFVTPPFSPASLRMVLLVLGGFILLGATGSAADWGPMGLMISFAAWMGAVLLFYAVRLDLERGFFSPSFRGSQGPALYAWSLVLLLATGIMLWGAGNTYEARYQESTRQLSIENASPYGAEILFRFLGAAVVAFAVLFSLALVKGSIGVRRSYLVPTLITFSSFVVLALTVFSVSVWSTDQQISNAYAGFGFHQFYTEEKIMVFVLLVALCGVLYACLARMVLPITRGHSAIVWLEAAAPTWDPATPPKRRT